MTSARTATLRLDSSPTRDRLEHLLTDLGALILPDEGQLQLVALPPAEPSPSHVYVWVVPREHADLRHALADAGLRHGLRADDPDVLARHTLRCALEHTEQRRGASLWRLLNDEHCRWIQHEARNTFASLSSVLSLLASPTHLSDSHELRAAALERIRLASENFARHDSTLLHVRHDTRTHDPGLLLRRARLDLQGLRGATPRGRDAELGRTLELHHEAVVTGLVALGAFVPTDRLVDTTLELRPDERPCLHWHWPGNDHGDPFEASYDLSQQIVRRAGLRWERTDAPDGVSLCLPL